MYEKGQLNFNKDIISGEKGENDIRVLLESKGFTFISDNKDNRYDLIMKYQGNQITYEIKTDILVTPSKDTGNMAIEFESRGKLSGISVTQADYFVYYLAHFGEVWNIKVSNLKKLIANNNFFAVNGGDKGSNTKMYLINRNKYRNYFKVHKIT